MHHPLRRFLHKSSWRIRRRHRNTNQGELFDTCPGINKTESRESTDKLDGTLFDHGNLQQHPTALEVISLSKQFGALKVLDEVSFKVKHGAFHALLGGNGAGKSTLVKCIMGYYRADAGAILVNDREHVFTSTRAAHALGLGMVYQHFTLVPAMTVLENLVLALTPIPRFIDWRQEACRLNELIAKTPFTLPLHKKVSELSAGEKQKVEILKQLFLKREILILDEPTSVLTPQEADEILGMLKQLTGNGNLTVLIITHKFREVMKFADAVTVLRRGRIVHSGPLAQNSPATLAEMMIGSDDIAATGARVVNAAGEKMLDIEGLFVRSDTGTLAVRNLSLQLHGGEILGIAGVSGNGQRELVEVLSGQRTAQQGTIQVHGENYRATREEMQRHKFHCLPEEPLRNACVPRMNLADNLALRVFDWPAYTRSHWFVSRKALLARARQLITRYQVKPPEPERPIETLSGGNVQRLVLARELSGEVEILVAANPCFGLDFAATAEIRRQLMQARNKGVAVLLLSEDLDEILELGDRIAVIFEGQLVYESPVESVDVNKIGLCMAGH